MHLLKILELLHILRNNPEPVEGVIAEAPDPAFVVVEVAPVEQSIAANGSTAPACVGHASVIIVARHWPGHGGRQWGVGRPHEPPQCLEGVPAWTRNPAVAADDERRVVIRHLY